MNIEIHSNVRKFLSKPLPNIIGKDQYLAANTPVVNPSDGSVLAEVSMGGAEEINRAVSAAEAAFPAWAGLPATERARLLDRFADALASHSAELAQLESLDVGKPITAAEGFDIPFGIECFRYFAKLAPCAQYNVPLHLTGIEARTWRTPYGVCGFIFPWNFPFTLLCWGAAPALAAGNTVVIKPSEVTPLTTLYAVQLALEAGLSAGRA